VGAPVPGAPSPPPHLLRPLERLLRALHWRRDGWYPGGGPRALEREVGALEGEACPARGAQRPRTGMEVERDDDSRVLVDCKYRRGTLLDTCSMHVLHRPTRPVIGESCFLQASNLIQDSCFQQASRRTRVGDRVGRSQGRSVSG
jgi:hypothetical protein